MVVFLLVYAVLGYLFFKYMLPLLRNKDPNNKPRELYNFYEKHPKLLVVTMILALFGIGEVINSIGGIINFIYYPCDNPQGGMISIRCFIGDGLF